MSRAAAGVTTLMARLINFNLMKAIRKVIENASASLTIDLPQEYQNKTIEVIVLPLEEIEEQPKKYDFSKFVGKLQWKGDALAEQRKLRDEWD
jgi:hypothetical protein